MDDNIKSNDIINLDPIKQENKKIINNILSEEEPGKLQDLVSLFNTNQLKRNILRATTLNDVLDSVAEQMKKRIQDHPDNFSNSEITEWLKIAQSALDKKENYSLENIQPIQFNQQVNVTVNDNENKVSRESREKIMDAVRSILGKIKSEDNNVIEIEPNITENTVIDFFNSLFSVSGSLSLKEYRKIHQTVRTKRNGKENTKHERP